MNIEIRNISFSYGEKPVFRDYSAVFENDVTVIEGASGIGKTTLLRLIAGIEAPSGGEITGVPESPAILFQEDRLLPWFTIRKNIELVSPDASCWLKLTEIEENADSLPGSLSGGQRRRAALARALSFGGGILLLDEPFKGLDPPLIGRITARVKELGVPIIVTSHSEFETRLWGGEVVTIERLP